MTTKNLFLTKPIIKEDWKKSNIWPLITKTSTEVSYLGHLQGVFVFVFLLKGSYLGFRSINITGDWRAIYSEEKNKKGDKTVIFEVLGTHSQTVQVKVWAHLY